MHIETSSSNVETSATNVCRSLVYSALHDLENYAIKLTSELKIIGQCQVEFDLLLDLVANLQHTLLLDFNALGLAEHNVLEILAPIANRIDACMHRLQLIAQVMANNEFLELLQKIKKNFNQLVLKIYRRT